MSIEQGPRQDRETGVNPADLPPIDNVAVPPLKHDADLNSSKHWQGVQETYHGPAIRPAPEQTDDVLTGRKTPDEVQGEVAQDRRLGSLPRVLGVGTAAALLTIVAKFGFDAANNDDKKVPVANKPVASAPVDPTPSETAAPVEEETVETEPLIEATPISIEDYPKPADAAKALEEFRLKFINNEFQDYSDYYNNVDSSLSYEEYLDNFLTVLYGDADVRNNSYAEYTLKLRDHYDSVNHSLKNYYGDDTYYHITLADMRIENVEGNTVKYKPLYEFNEDAVPVDSRDEEIEMAIKDGNELVTVELGKENGNWIIAQHTTS